MTPQPWTPGEGGSVARRHAPATARNRDAIAAVLADWLPPQLRWQPSDPDPAAIASIAAWSAEAALPNVAPPLRLDAAAADWPIASADALLCINMVHISPWAATLGLFAGAARLLPSGAPLILYGPYLEADIVTADSNRAFDASLRVRNAEWGLRDTVAVEEAAALAGFVFVGRRSMPANNIMLRFRRS